MSVLAAIGIWLVAVVGFGLLGFAVVGALNESLLECSGGLIHQPPGRSAWLVAVAAAILPVTVATAVSPPKHRPRLVSASGFLAIVELSAWAWLFKLVCWSALVS